MLGGYSLRYLAFQLNAWSLINQARENTDCRSNCRSRCRAFLESMVSTLAESGLRSSGSKRQYEDDNYSHGSELFTFYSGLSCTVLDHGSQCRRTIRKETENEGGWTSEVKELHRSRLARSLGGRRLGG